jgi:hypothetical protein
MEKIRLYVSQNLRDFNFDAVGRSGVNVVEVPVVSAHALARLDIRDRAAMIRASVERAFMEGAETQDSSRYLGFLVPDDGMKDWAAKGSAVIVDLEDRKLEDGALCVAVVGDSAVFRRFRNTNGPERLDLLSPAPGLEATCAPNFRIVGRAISASRKMPLRVL